MAWFGVRLGPSTFAIFDAFPMKLAASAFGRKSGRRVDGERGRLADRTTSIQKADVLASNCPVSSLQAIGRSPSSIERHDEPGHANSASCNFLGPCSKLALSAR